MVLEELQTKVLKTVTRASTTYTRHPKNSSGAISGDTRIWIESWRNNWI